MDKVMAATAEREDYASKYVPDLHRALWARANSGECSPRQAIKAKCQSCMGYEDTVSRVRDCATWKCPLWAFRPYQEVESREVTINEGKETV